QVHTEKVGTPGDGLYVAGNLTGIESAKVAAAQGRVAGLSMAESQANDKKGIDRRIGKAVQVVKSTRKEAAIQFHPEIEEGRSRMERAFQEYDSGRQPL